MIETLQNLWFGYLQFGVASGTSIWLIVFDLLVTAILVFFCLKAIASKKGWRFISLLFVILVLFVGSSFLNLSTIHLLSQFLLIVAAILLPIIFHEEWIKKFNGQTENLDTVKSNNYYLIIFTLLITLVVGVFTNGVSAKTALIPQEISVKPVNLTEGLAARLSQENVKITVSAPRNVWSGLSADTFTAVVDVGERKEGTYDIQVSVTSKIDDVKIRRIEPSNLVVSVEPIIARTVPVGVRFIGQASEGLVPDIPVIKPDRVEVSGPRSLVTNLLQVSAEINISGLSASMSQKYLVQAYDSEGKVIQSISANPEEVLFDINFVRAGKLKTVGIRPTVIGQPAQGFWVSELILSPPAVTVTGPVDLLDKTTHIITENIDVTALNSETTRQINLALPPGIILAEDNQRVSVTIKISASLTQKQILPVIKFNNLNRALKVVNYTPQNITVLITGPTNQLTTIDGQIELNIDLSPYKSAGTYAISISRDSFSVPSGINIISFLPSTIDVILDNR